MASIMADIINRLQVGKPILLDGGTGALTSEFRLSRADTLLPWGVDSLVSYPTAVMNFHADYVAAGCDIITANAFRTAPTALRDSFVTVLGQSIGLKSSELTLQGIVDGIGSDWQGIHGSLTQLALLLAHVARARTPGGNAVAVAGNITTLKDCYRPDLVSGSEMELIEAHSKQIEQLVRNRQLIDLVLAETMNTGREARAAVQAALNIVPTIPVWVSFVLERLANSIPGRAVTLYPDARKRTGECLSTAIDEVLKARGESGQSVGAILFNCTTPEAITAALRELSSTGQIEDLRRKGVFVGAYANAQTEVYEGFWSRDSDFSHEAYGNHAMEWLELGAQILGGCCGTRPRDMAHIRSLLNRRAAAI